MQNAEEESGSKRRPVLCHKQQSASRTEHLQHKLLTLLKIYVLCTLVCVYLYYFCIHLYLSVFIFIYLNEAKFTCINFQPCIEMHSYAFKYIYINSNALVLLYLCILLHSSAFISIYLHLPLFFIIHHHSYAIIFIIQHLY